MELAGDEKKIQALFRELKLEDERVAPAFSKLWNRAQSESRQSRPAMRTSFAVAAAVLVITLCTLAFWSRNWQSGRQNSRVASGSTTAGSKAAPAPVTPEPKQLVLDEGRNRVRFNRLPRKLATRRQTEFTTRNAGIREALAILSWQSPTATLMQSPADGVLTSLPRLDRSVTELKSFLPNIQLKESQ
jgi:hypothetical protein